MKGYTIWLRSGQSIVGEFTEEQAQAARAALDEHTRVCLSDTDGLLILNPDDIVAMSITNPDRDTSIHGFRE